jgi:hypothetical protein
MVCGSSRPRPVRSKRAPLSLPPPALLAKLKAHRAELVAALSAAEADGFGERAAIIKSGGVPRAWAEGYARLHPDLPPGDVPLRRWQTFVDDCARFLDGGWAKRVAALGWGPLDLFGRDRERPFARIDHAGLLWLVNGDRLIALSENWDDGHRGTNWFTDSVAGSGFYNQGSDPASPFRSQDPLHRPC